MNTYDPHAQLRAAHAAGRAIQANRGTDTEPFWVTLESPQFTCPADQYRIAPEDDTE